MDITTASAIVFPVLFGLLALGVPIAFSLGIAGVLGITLIKAWSTAASFLGMTPFSATANWAWTIVPLFILMGNLAYHTGVVGQAYDAVLKWTGRLPGSLAVATSIGCGAMAGVTGSSVAVAATFGKIAIPPMLERGYDKRLATGVVAASGTFGILIPPSIILVIYGMFAEQSIGRLLLAGIIPGAITVTLYVAFTLLLARARPHMAPALPEAVPWKERFRALLGMWQIAALFLIVIGGIYAGIFTAIEAAAWGAFVALVLLLIKARKQSWAPLKAALMDAAQTTSMIFAVVIGAILFSLFIIVGRVPYYMSEFLVGLNVPSFVLIGLIILMYIVMGMFLEAMSIIMITVPIIAPLMIALGYDLIWFGVIIVKVIEIGMVTPPVGLNCFVIKAVTPEVSLEDIFWGACWYIPMDLIVIALLFAFPAIATIIPDMAMG